MERDNLTFGEQLVLAEEEARLEQQSMPGLDREVLVINRENFTTSDSFHIKDPGRTLPVDGPGVLDELIVVADVDTFDVFVEVDDQEVAAGAFTKYKDDTVELERISAFERKTGRFAFGVHDYPFQKSVDAVISPTESTTFNLQRIEIDLVRDS